MLKSKQDLLAELIALLSQNLPTDTYESAPTDPANGNLPFDIPYIRLEPWVYGTETISLKGAWELCIESALMHHKTPVLAHQWHGVWSFRVPLYVFSAEYFLSLDDQQYHSFEYSVDLNVEGFALVIEQYQKEQNLRDVWMEALTSVMGRVKP